MTSQIDWYELLSNSKIEEFNKWRLANLTTKLDISEKKISGTDLSNAFLSGIKCTNTDFSKCNMRGTNLVQAEASNAIFEGSNLTDALFMYT